MTGHRGGGPRQLQSEASRDYSRIPLKQVELYDRSRDSDLKVAEIDLSMRLFTMWGTLISDDRYEPFHP